MFNQPFRKMVSSMSKQELQNLISQNLRSLNFLRTNPEVDILTLEHVLEQITLLNDKLKEQI